MSKKEYHKKYHAEWYKKNKDKRQQQIHNRRDELKQFVIDIKKESRCNRCGESDYRCLDFHHKDSSKKEAEVCNATRYGWSKTRIIKEIEKCEIICSNCHRKEHF